MCMLVLFCSVLFWFFFLDKSCVMLEVMALLWPSMASSEQDDQFVNRNIP